MANEGHSRNPSSGPFLDSTDHSPSPESPLDSALHRPDSQSGSAPPPDGTTGSAHPSSFANLHVPAGATVFPPGAPPSSTTNPRSCVTCRRRKVRCDKHMPCGNCRRAQISCIFPAPGRAPRRPRPKDPNAPPKQHSSEREIELVKRLRKLEGIVEELSGQIELEAVRHSSSDGHSPEATVDGDRHMFMRTDTSGSHGPGSHNRGSPAASSESRKEFARSASGHEVSPFGGLVRSPTELNKNFGRLVLNDKGTSRYISSGFWSKINDELNDLRGATQNLAGSDSDSSDSEDNESVLQSAEEEDALDHQAFIMGYRSADVDLRPLHPLPSQVPFLWQIYQENVDPILKILHVPSVEQMMREKRACFAGLSPSTEALWFTIYYAAVTSMEAEDVKRTLGAEKSQLLHQYRFAVEQALAKANFITDPDLTVCQAFVMFLMLVRRHDKARFSWTLTGLAVRICQAIGIHRDGTNFPHLKPFEIEMRRRLFWSLLMLDLRAAEDQGTECIISDGSFDTQFPLNINDADISPDSTEFPKPREGSADITLCLIRFEICNLARKMHTASTTVPTDMTRQETLSMLQERENMLLDHYSKLEEKYLRDSSAEENPMYWVAGNIARVIVAKMITVIYQPILFALPVDTLSCRLRERLFLAAVEIFEYNSMLNSDPRCKQWRWLFRTYTQWHAVAYLLLELCNRDWSATSERAWAAINACFGGSHSLLTLERMAVHSNTAVWLPFKKLYHRAKKHRDAELTRLRADPEAAEHVDAVNRARDPPSGFGRALSNSIKTSIAQERWRKLVNLPAERPEETGPRPRCRYASDPEEMNNNTNPQHQTHPSVSTTQDQPPQTSPVSMPPYSSHQLDALVSEAISNPQFEATHILPLAFGHRPEAGIDDPMSLARGMIFNAGLFVPPSNPNPPTTSAPSSNHQHPHQQHHGLPPVSGGGRQEDDNPPVWLWNDAGQKVVSQIADAVSGGNGAVVGDGDVNMDEGLEGFDWQNWQESARGFEIETGGAGSHWFGGMYGI